MEANAQSLSRLHIQQLRTCYNFVLPFGLNRSDLYLGNERVQRTCDESCMKARAQQPKKKRERKVCFIIFFFRCLLRRRCHAVASTKRLTFVSKFYAKKKKKEIRRARCSCSKAAMRRLYSTAHVAFVGRGYLHTGDWRLESRGVEASEEEK